MAKPLQKILFYSPYGLFTPHIMREMIMTQRLLEHGHEVVNLACDKVFEICDYKNECSKCHNISRGHLSNANFSTKWLSQYTKSEDRINAQTWLETLQPKDYPKATFGNLSLGDWILSSVHFTLKISKLDFSDPVILSTTQNFLIDGYVFACAANRIFDEGNYSKIIMTNGRFFSHRIFLEMAKLRNISVMTHEYGHYHQTIQFQHDLISNSYNNLSAKWYESNRKPLNLQALLHVHQILLDKRFHRRSPYGFFTPLPTKISKGKNSKMTVLCALSSEYEYNASPDFPHIIGTQVDWMKLLIPEIGNYPNHHFIIKLHPNSEKSIVDDMKMLFANINLKNCEVLWPNTTKSTYDLIEESDYVMVFWSTVGMEAACAGKKVFCITHCAYYGAPFLKSLSSVDAHSEELKDFLLDLKPISNIQEEAYRFCYRYFIEQSVPFTATSNPKGSVTIYNRPVEHYRGSSNLNHDPYLDYMVDCIENEQFPETSRINGSYQNFKDVHEKFFFRILSLINFFGGISETKKKILLIHDKQKFISNHCFENAVRIGIFDESIPLDWVAYLLWLDGHQVYILNPNNIELLEQWAHEYGAYSGSHNLRILLNHPLLFKIVSEILFKSPFLMNLGRKLLFKIGKWQNKPTAESLFNQFSNWFNPDITFNSSIKMPENTLFSSYAFTNENLEKMMNDPRFEKNMNDIFTALQSQIR